MFPTLTCGVAVQYFPAEWKYHNTDNAIGNCVHKPHIPQKEFVEFDNISIHWAIAILIFIDEHHKQLNICQMKSSIWWIEFENHIKGTRSSDQIIQLIESNYYIETIRKTVSRIDKRW